MGPRSRNKKKNAKQRRIGERGKKKRRMRTINKEQERIKGGRKTESGEKRGINMDYNEFLFTISPDTKLVWSSAEKDFFL